MPDAMDGGPEAAGRAEAPCDGDTAAVSKASPTGQATPVAPPPEEVAPAPAAPTAAPARPGDRPKLPRPEGQQACPRCESLETKFCYYNNYNIKQPRYYCKSCQRYWTAGGALRDVPVGAGRRKSKGVKSHEDGDGLCVAPMPGMGTGGGALEPMAAAFAMGVSQPLAGVLPGLLVSAAFPPVDAMAKPTSAARAGQVEPAASLQAVSARSGRTSGQDRQAEAVLDGAIDGRRTKPKIDGPNAAGAQKPPALPDSAAADAAVPMANPGMLPYNMAAFDWINATTAQNPHAAAALHAQFQAAAAGYNPHFAMAAGMWPYAAFTGWPASYPSFPFNPMDPMGGMQPGMGLDGKAGNADGIPNPLAAIKPPVAMPMPVGGMQWPGPLQPGWPADNEAMAQAVRSMLPPGMAPMGGLMVPIIDGPPQEDADLGQNAGP